MNHKNSIIRRMFANAATPACSTPPAIATTGADNDTTLQADQASTAEAPVSPVVANTRRNLFGIRLNHEQLKQDLNDMWKDQIDRQNQSWGFDFQKLKPLDKVSPAANETTNPTSQHRFEWTKVHTRLNPFYNETDVKASTVFDKEELTADEEYETEEEEYDDALAVPTFYKYQRRAKLNAEHNNRLKFIQLAKASSSPATAIKKPTASKTLTASSTSKKPVRNSNSKRQQRTVTPKVQKSLIITFSENRKDTLRSSASKSLANMFEASSSSVETRVQATATTTSTSSVSSSSAFRQPMKQQSLLDMLKQRKRKATTDAKSVADEASVVHNLRTRTVSIN